MSFSNIKIFANANSGTLNRKSLESACAHINKFVPSEIIYTNDIESAKREIKKYESDCSPLLVACGGDGSIGLLLNNISLSKTFGIIPQGTANVIAAELGIPDNTLNACKGLLSYAVNEIDVGLCNGYRFLFTAGIGFDAESAYSVSKSLKKRFGQYAYYVSTILSFIKHKPAIFNVKAENNEYKGAWLVVSNMRRYGGNLFFSPQARYDDGKLDAVLLKKLNLKSIMRILCYAKGKISFPEKEAIYIKSDSISVSAEEPTLYQLDGEVYDPQCGFELSVSSERAKIITP